MVLTDIEKSKSSEQDQNDEESELRQLRRGFREKAFLYHPEGKRLAVSYYEKMFPACKDSSAWARILPRGKIDAIKEYEDNPPEYEEAGLDARLLEGMTAENIRSGGWFFLGGDRLPQVLRPHMWDDHNHHVDLAVSVPDEKIGEVCFGLDVTTDGGKKGDDGAKIFEKITKSGNGKTRYYDFTDPNFFGFTRVDMYGHQEKEDKLTPERSIAHIPRFTIGLDSEELIAALSNPSATQIVWPEDREEMPSSITIIPASKEHRQISFKLLSEIYEQAFLYGIMLPSMAQKDGQALAEAEKNIHRIQSRVWNSLSGLILSEDEAARQLYAERDFGALNKHLEQRIRMKQEKLIKEEQKKVAGTGQNPVFGTIMKATGALIKGFSNNPALRKNFSRVQPRDVPFTDAIFENRTYSFDPD